MMRFRPCHFAVKTLLILGAVSLLVLPTASLSAQDWPQVLGASRNGAAREVKFDPAKWPSKLDGQWSVTLGSGYAGPAVVGNQVIVSHRLDDQETVTSFDSKTGKRIWQTNWDATYLARFNPDDGPRCVPTVMTNRVVVYGAAGDLACLELANGKEIWRRSLRKEYKADDGYFGAGSAPLILGDQIIVCLGGRQGGIVALSLDSGKTNWTATKYDASYASPIAVNVDGKTRVLVVARLNTVLLDPANGEILGDVSFGARGPTVNAATPIKISEGQYLLTASYGIGALALSVSSNGLSETFREKSLLRSQYNTPVHFDNRVIGIDGREDVGGAALRAIDVRKRSVIWEEPNFGTAHLIALENTVLALTVEGQLSLLDVAGSKLKVLKSNQLLEGTYRALPALSESSLYVRSSAGRNSILTRYDLQR